MRTAVFFFYVLRSDKFSLVNRRSVSLSFVLFPNKMCLDLSFLPNALWCSVRWYVGGIPLAGPTLKEEGPNGMLLRKERHSTFVIPIAFRAGLLWNESFHANVLGDAVHHITWPAHSPKPLPLILLEIRKGRSVGHVTARHFAETCWEDTSSYSYSYSYSYSHHVYRYLDWTVIQISNTLKRRYKTPACFGTKVPSSGSYLNKGI
jgi:hypothetical protein